MPTRIMPWILRSLLAATLVVAAAGQDAALRYPETRKSDTVDRYSGTAVPDPYRWLENTDAVETTAWVEAQNSLTFAHLARLPVRDAYRRRLTLLWDYEKFGLPRREAGQLFYSKNTGLQRQSVLYRETASGEPLVVLDPNQLSPDGSLALMTAAPSPDARYLAYAVSEGGADFFELRIREVDGGRDLPDRVKWVKMSETSWTKDGRGFFYSRYPAPGEGRALTEANTGHQLCYHRVGTDQARDLLVYQRPDHPDWIFQAHVSEEGRYVVIISARGTETNKRVFFIDLGDPLQPRVTAPVTALLDSGDANYGFVGVRGSRAYLTTNRDAPKYRVITADLASPSRARVETVVPEAGEVIDGATFGMGCLLAGGHLVVNYLSDVKGRLRLFDLEGKALGELPLPGIGAVSGLQGRDDTSEVFYAFSSFLAPTTVHRRDLKTGITSAFHPPRTAFEPSRYETRQVFYPSKDGTRVPMFITARKELALDGRHPTVLYAYGGFGINVTPTFQPEVAAWLEQGGVYAVPNLRGGGEFGEDWHKAGMLSKKQNVFDDFIAAAEYLIREKITSPERLAIHGFSNGGLLVGATMAQRPELFAVAYPGAGVMDMLRYHKFTIGAFWITEFGSADDPAQFAYLYRYSPLHNLKAGICYPATIVTTADHDDRVVPGHSFKFAATLQAAQGCSRPVLLRVATQASHNYTPTDKQIAELSDVWAFTAAHTGMSGFGSHPTATAAGIR